MRLALVLVLCAVPASADWTATGRFLYTDRLIDQEGFTGVDVNLPIRLADVEVVDANTSAVLASGATNSTGNFSFTVVDAATRDIIIRAKTTSTQTSDLFIRVRNLTSMGGLPYAIAHPTILAHGPTTSVNFASTPIVAGIALYAGGP